MPSITLRELAALAGCSHATVSLALRKHPRISAETRERILKLARETGYSRDPVVASLMTQLRTTKRNRSFEKIALLSYWDTPDAWRTSPHDTTGFQGACSRAAELGYEIEEFWGKAPGITSQRLSKILHTRGIRGLIVGPLPRPWGHVSLNWTHFAAVAIGNTVVRPGLHRVIHSQSQGMSLALRSLKHQGYERIGFTSLIDQSRRVNQGWLAAYLLHSYEQPAKLRVPPLILKSWNREEYRRWLEKHKPDAIVSNYDVPLHFLSDLGLRVPEDMAFASLDRMHETDPYAGIDQLRGKMFGAAVDLLVSLIESNQFGLSEHPKIVHFEGVWKAGPTVKKKMAVT